MRYLFGLIILLASCQHPEPPEFTDWYANHSNKSTVAGEKPNSYKANFYSGPLLIDTIYRSMQGPYEIKKLQLAEEKDDLLWIIGYQSEVFYADRDKKLGAEYMCHNNLNYSNKASFPWKIKTSGANSRIFTLSEGQTRLEFPEGFGIPIPGNQGLDMVSQVLNHHQNEIHLESRHHVQFDYLKDSELNSPMKALYQQSIFVTKQIAGPAGSYGLSELCIDHHLDSNALKGNAPAHDCSIDISSKHYDPYRDSHGRIYTGHWRLPIGRDTLTTDVTRMLDLQEDSRIHMIGVHLHPYGQSLSLWDKSNDSLLYSAELKPKSDGFGFDTIGYYKSTEGIPVYLDHQYELVSVYNCTDSVEEHTAMAVMYLYLSEE